MNQTAFFWFDVICWLLCSIAYTRTVHGFITKHFACAQNREKAFILFLTASLPVLNICLLYGSLPFPLTDLLNLLWTGQLLVWVVLFYRGETTAKILAASILTTATLLLSHFISSFLSCIELILLHSMHAELSPLSAHIADNLNYGVIFACIVCAINHLSKHMTHFFANRPHSWYIMLSIPLLGISLLWYIIDLGASRGILFRGGDHLNLYYNQIFSHTGLCILSALCMCAAGFYVFGMDRIDTESRKKEQYLAQVGFYQMLGEQYYHQERLRHDMKNHIIALQRLADNQEWNKLTNYLHRMAETGGMEYADHLTGNNIVDALLYYKHNQAKQAHIRWECDVHISPACTIDEFDLCVVFGNILDNALTACTKMDECMDKFIQIQAHMVRKCLLLEVINSTGHKDEAGYSKKTYIPPGIGLQNVKDTVNKYNGTMAIDRNNDTFRITVLLPYRI